MSEQSRRIFERREILITATQENAVQADADARYPELVTPQGRKRNFSPALRDIIDFWMAHQDIFLPWLTMRRQIATPEQE